MYQDKHSSSGHYSVNTILMAKYVTFTYESPVIFIAVGIEIVPSKVPWMFAALRNFVSVSIGILIRLQLGVGLDLSCRRFPKYYVIDGYGKVT